MSDLDDDPIWPHFRPLWCSLHQAGREQVTIAGGYGLFLKQKWLIRNSDIPLAVPIRQWRDETPRATKDVDLVVGLDLIANQELQPIVLSKLNEEGFRVAEERDGQFWRFQKIVLPQGSSIVIELHAPTPPADHPDLTSNRKKVKRREILADPGYDARHTAASVGFQLHPFPFELDNTALTVVNPITWTCMKILAMRSHREDSLRGEISTERRNYHQSQADKHARDVFRVIAMVTRDERDRSDELLAALQPEAVFEQVIRAYRDDFGVDGWALRAVAPSWDEEGVVIIQSVLNSWFPKGS